MPGLEQQPGPAAAREVPDVAAHPEAPLVPEPAAEGAHARAAPDPLYGVALARGEDQDRPPADAAPRAPSQPAAQPMREVADPEAAAAAHAVAVDAAARARPLAGEVPPWGGFLPTQARGAEPLAARPASAVEAAGRGRAAAARRGTAEVEPRRAAPVALVVDRAD